MHIASPLSAFLLLVKDGEARDGDGRGKHELQVDVPLPHEVGDLPGVDVVRAMLVVLMESHEIRHGRVKETGRARVSSSRGMLESRYLHSDSLVECRGVHRLQRETRRTSHLAPCELHIRSCDDNNHLER